MKRISQHSDRHDLHSMSEKIDHQFKPKSRFAPYILLLALSLHGLFEGIALGIQRVLKDTVFLFIAILAHKWAEAFSLVKIKFYF